MATLPNFDLAAADTHFAAHCFNCAWDLIEKPDRTPEEERLMVALSQADEARRLAEICLEYSRELGPFHQGYVQEALARAALVAGDRQRQMSHLALAQTHARGVESAEDRDLLVRDLDSLA